MKFVINKSVFFSLCLALFISLIFFVNSSSSQQNLTFTETDWNNNNFESQTNIDTTNSPGQLLLKNDPANMVSAFQAIAAPKSIYDMVVYKDKLIMSACTSLDLTSDAYVLSYDYLTNNTTQIYSYAQGLKEQGIDKLYVFNDKLYTAGADRDDGGWDLGAIYIYDGASWTRKLTVPQDVHGFSLAYYKGKLYIVISYGADEIRLYESANDGDSWLRTANNMTASMYGRELIVYNDKLAVIGDPTDRILIYDGAAWQNNKNFSLMTLITGYANFNNKLFLNAYTAGTPYYRSYYTSDLTTANEISYFSGKGLGDLVVYDNKLYTAEYTPTGSQNPPPSSVSYKLHYSSDGVNWQGHSQNIQSTYRAVGRLYPQLQQYHGRLYLGGTDGNVFVSAAASSGNLVSNPINLTLQDTTISWEGLVPTGTSLKFQIRTAKSQNELTSKPFLGADDTEGSYYETSGATINSVHNGDAWFQYKVFMATTDPKLTPYLNSFTLTSSPVPQDATPPVRSNGQPSGTLPYSTSQTQISLTTNENATCKYGTTININYNSLPSTFLTTGGTSHSVQIAGLTSSSTYTYYIRCQDNSGNSNTDDFTIAFSVAPSPNYSSGDLNKDGKVNLSDASILLSKWESTNATDLQECDINPGPGNISQGKIDLYDANLMMKNWNP